MKTTPLLFKAEMVRAILLEIDPKTQTRRTEGLDAVNAAPDDWKPLFIHPVTWIKNQKPTVQFLNIRTRLIVDCISKKGMPGDQIWVKETFCYDDFGDPIYRATEPDQGCSHPEDMSPWKPSIFMPRKSSRITLELTEVRVERLNEISEADAIAEGVNPHVEAKWWQGYRKDDPLMHTCAEADENGNPRVWIIEAKPYRDLSHLNRTAKQEYAILWESINDPGSWAANPFVWVYEFKKL